MRKNQYEKMTQTKVSVLILSLGLPTTVSMLVTNIYNVADTYFVGKIGTSASGAIGIVFALMAILQAVGFMFGHGAGSIISRKLGAGEIEDARKFASTSFFCSIMCGVLVALAGIAFIDPFMCMLGSTQTILPYARTYAFFILLAAPAMTSSCVMNNILRYEGKAFFAMIGMTAGAFLNIFGDAFFMRVLHMGIEGAGLSTAISQYISAGILLSVFLRNKTQSRFAIRYFTRDGRDILQIIQTGFPSLVRQGLSSVSTMLLNQQAGYYGDVAIAAMSIVSRVSNFLFCVGLGIGQGYQPVAGFNYGAGKYSRVRQGFLFTWFFGTILLGIFALSGLLQAHTIIGFFSEEQRVVDAGTTALRLQCVSLFFLPFAVSANMMFQSIGASKTASFLSALRGGIFYIPLLFMLPVYMKMKGIMLAQPIADLLACLITIPFVVRFFKRLPMDASLPCEKSRRNGDS